MKEDETNSGMERVKTLRDKRKFAQSSLTRETDCIKGEDSRKFLTETQIEQRMQRYKSNYRQASGDFTPKPVKRATKDEYYKLLKDINNR